jgi:hypothetical protein
VERRQDKNCHLSTALGNVSFHFLSTLFGEGLQAVGGLVGEMDRECFHGFGRLDDWLFLQGSVNESFPARSEGSRSTGRRQRPDSVLQARPTILES